MLWPFANGVGALRATAAALFGLVTALVLLASPTLAAPHKKPAPPAPTSLDACDLQGLTGQGYTIATGNTCWQVTGGVSYWSSWGNAQGGDDGGPGGQFIVQTPAGDYTIPAPRH